MAFSLIGHDVGAVGNTDSTTTPSIDTTGADLLVAVCTDLGGNALVLTDSKSNTWTALTKKTNVIDTVIMYVKNPTVGTGHTFAIGSGGYPSLEVAAFSGSDLTSPFDVENGGSTGGAASLSTGSITPGSANELVIAGLGTESMVGTKSITLLAVLDQAADNGNNFGGALAYEIQTTATARNPSWSWSGSHFAAAVIASFKAAAAAASFTYFPLIQPDVAGLLRKAEMQGY